MPHPDYGHRSGVLIACSGPAEVQDPVAGPREEFASKASANLDYAIADVEQWARDLYGPPVMGKDCLRERVLLREATRGEVMQAVTNASDHLNAHNDHSRGGTLDLYFSGHGFANGDLCLADGPLSPDDLADTWSEGNASGETRHIRVVLDCCFAGMTLARLYLHPGHWSTYVLRDAWAASLPSEEAFELPRVGHGVLTYVRTRPDPLTILGRSQVEGRHPSEEELRQANRADRETPHYLTNGRQQALDFINGHAVSVLGGHRDAYLELGDREWSLDALAAAFDELPRRRERPNP